MLKIDQAETASTDRIVAFQNAPDRPAQILKQVACGQQLAVAMESLPQDTRDPAPGSPLPDCTPSTPENAVEEARKHLHQRERAFIQDIRTRAEAVGLNVGRHGQSMFLGPFEIALNWEREVASIRFAKVRIAKAKPLVAKDLITYVGRISKKLLTPPATSDLPGLADQVEEVLRACVNRRGGSSVGELRVDLPTVYRELRIIKQGGHDSEKRACPYPLVKFVVDIKTLVQSAFNATHVRRFRLETAVIENTRNPKKSVFIPNDLQKGYGEGTYYQAILLTHKGQALCT